MICKVYMKILTQCDEHDQLNKFEATTQAAYKPWPNFDRSS